MQTFSFTCTIKNHTVCSEEMAEAICEAGGDDSGIGSSEGIVTIYLEREAESLDAAIRSAVATVYREGYQISRIEMDEAQMESLLAG